MVQNETHSRSSAERSVFDLAEREQIRRHALRIAFSSWSRADERRAALEDLALVVEHDKKFPLGAAAHLSADEIRALVSVIVRDADIPEPWLTRFGIASIGSTRRLSGAYAYDWENFLRLWNEEQARLLVCSGGSGQCLIKEVCSRSRCAIYRSTATKSSWPS